MPRRYRVVQIMGQTVELQKPCHGKVRITVVSSEYSCSRYFDGNFPNREPEIYPMIPCALCVKDFSEPAPYLTSRYFQANTTQTTPITTKQSKLPSGPTTPPVSQSGPCNE